MMFRTHLALGFVVALYFLPHVNNKFVFLPVVLAASLLPNIDLIFASEKTHKAIQPLKSIFTRRGWLHTYTTCILVSLFFAFFYPVLALPFFLGYSFHLTLDAFTPEGIVPFWPIKKKSTGHVSTGGKIDRTIFYVLIVFAVALLVQFFV